MGRVKTWGWILAAVALVGAASVGIAFALPGDALFPEAPTTSPAPTISTSNWLDPAFSFRSAVIVVAAIVAMIVIALIARTVERRRGR